MFSKVSAMNIYFFLRETLKKEKAQLMFSHPCQIQTMRPFLVTPEKGGFTLLELLCLLIDVIAILSTPFFPRNSSFAVHQFLRDKSSVLFFLMICTTLAHTSYTVVLLNEFSTRMNEDNQSVPCPGHL
jgi:hypothetical protein